jgi:hypothetical protein
MNASTRTKVSPARRSTICSWLEIARTVECPQRVGNRDCLPVRNQTLKSPAPSSPSERLQRVVSGPARRDLWPTELAPLLPDVLGIEVTIATLRRELVRGRRSHCHAYRPVSRAEHFLLRKRPSLFVLKSDKNGHQRWDGHYDERLSGRGDILLALAPEQLAKHLPPPR